MPFEPSGSDPGLGNIRLANPGDCRNWRPAFEHRQKRKVQATVATRHTTANASYEDTGADGVDRLAERQLDLQGPPAVSSRGRRPSGSLTPTHPARWRRRHDEQVISACAWRASFASARARALTLGIADAEAPAGGSLRLPQELGEYAWRHVALGIHQDSLSSWVVREGSGFTRPGFTRPWSHKALDLQESAARSLLSA